MIKFFRKIRQRLFNENKFSKYLIYAIGEIVLVVIGILIALQLNNLKQESVNQKLEVKILKEINRNLTTDLNEIQFDISLLDSVSSACSNIISNLKTISIPTNKLFYDISKLRVTPHFDANKSGYDFLQSKGVDLITKDSLRELISIQYELNYPYYYKYENERIQFKNHHSDPILLKYFSWSSNSELFFNSSFKISNEDFLEINKNNSLEKLVLAISFQNDLLKNRAKRLEQQTNKLIDLINKELRLIK